MIQLYEITKEFGTFRAVDGVSLTVTKGKIFGLLGANGAGKTTLIRMMCGILPPSGGSGRVMGHDMIKGQKKIKRQIGYMSQKFSLYPDLTVKENILFYARLYGVTDVRGRVNELLELFQLQENSHKKVSSLGGGIRQRVAFASAIVHSPPLLFLDEPTSGVDPLTRRLFWEQLYELTERGTTILVTTHYMDEAERCDEVGLMNEGKMVAKGGLNDLQCCFADALQKEKPSLEDIFVYVMTGQGGYDDGEGLGKMGPDDRRRI
ncbi:ABC transporter ATP-binding protein [Paenactinomyces guangxiensis]|uniref:ABC transporter ATP-binding protein n=1 Tax=Paenactinomyces guangxiensis TaxID=1490290 RepID=A0A7W1WRP0_9BACL|nr:ABC transporter ATP-binding protein [Paenactinomyces guangxiensis]MBA4494828.1 ABC transporter ATP-binding protein [Paenactinomyces guangxiensis]MBH8591911.1 ABC transporter ATP-binding protein [Paenactinomyces guangxiensis]